MPDHHESARSQSEFVLKCESGIKKYVDIEWEFGGRGGFIEEHEVGSGRGGLSQESNELGSIDISKFR